MEPQPGNPLHSGVLAFKVNRDNSLYAATYFEPQGWDIDITERLPQTVTNIADVFGCQEVAVVHMGQMDKGNCALFSRVTGVP